MVWFVKIMDQSSKDVFAGVVCLQRLKLSESFVVYTNAVDA